MNELDDEHPAPHKPSTTIKDETYIIDMDKPNIPIEDRYGE